MSIDFGDIKNVDLSRLLTRDHCTAYVGLLCEFEPDSVLPFLRVQDHLVDLDQCKVRASIYGRLFQLFCIVYSDLCV